MSEINRPLLLLVLVMFGFGVMMVASASLVLASNANARFGPLHFMILQLIWLSIGLVIAVVIYNLPLSLFNRTSALIMLVTIGLLIAVLLIGTDVYGARRWIEISALDFQIQPSEIAKLGFIIYLAAWLSRPQKQIKDFKTAVKEHFWRELLPFLLMLGMIFLLILQQPDLDTAVIIGATALIVYFVSGQDIIHLLGSISIVVLGVLMAIIAAVSADYRLQRVMTYLDFYRTGEFSLSAQQGSAFQVRNCLIAISEGGWVGVGYGQSKNKLYYLSNAVFSDSIFCVVAEEFGLMGSLALLVAFLLFLSIGFEISRQANSQFTALLALGITVWITLQGLLNIGANLAVIPFGGIPMPFLSYGGSSTLITITGVAILMSIHKDNKRHERK